jgi:hypothetical protein
MGDHHVGPGHSISRKILPSEWMIRITRTAHGPWRKVKVRTHALCSLLLSELETLPRDKAPVADSGLDVIAISDWGRGGVAAAVRDSG